MILTSFDILVITNIVYLILIFISISSAVIENKKVNILKISYERMFQHAKRLEKEIEEYKKHGK
jgi:hypothetical protein